MDNESDRLKVTKRVNIFCASIFEPFFYKACLSSRIPQNISTDRIEFPMVRGVRSTV
jgi:hypothetical protein